MTEGVVLLLTGPLQSWGGTAAGIYERGTESMPSMSGVIGMVANALGRERTDDIKDLAAGAEMAVRADRPGIVTDDYHTIGAPGRYAINAEGKPLRHSVITKRWYLQDAAFLAVYTPPPHGMSAEEVMGALLDPVRPLYLGRRSCPPAERVAVCTTRQRTSDEVLASAPLLRDSPDLHRRRFLSEGDYFAGTPKPIEHVDVLVEKSVPEDAAVRATQRPDAPVTFDSRRLAHTNRGIVTETIQVPIMQCAGRGTKALIALYQALEIES